MLVVGTGAMASLFAARLARSERAHVTLAGTWREALSAIAARGIAVEEDGGAWTARVASAAIEDSPGPADFVLVLVKSYQTSAVASSAARGLGAGGLLVTLQNGLGNRELLEAAAGRGRVAFGAATLGATLLGPGRVRAVPGRIVLGAEDATGEAVEQLATLLRAAGFETDVSRDVERVVWRKLAVNCAINPLSAVLGVPNGALLESQKARGTLVRAAREVGAVAAARGIELAADPAELAIEVAVRTAANRSSMLQDLDRGAPTEIDALCGAVVKEGRRLGVATPVNESLWDEVKQRERAAPAVRLSRARG